MKRLIIICEGPTENQFCNQALRAHFLSKNIVIHTPYPKWSGGGDIDWHKLKTDIELHLKSDKQAFVTTFIDFYGLSHPTKFPGYVEADKFKSDIYRRVQHLQRSVSESIDENLRRRFIPNFILHEFESLLFNDICFFDDLLERNEFKNRAELVKVLSNFSNPELINETPDTCPSKRLKNMILKNYTKTDLGVRLAVHIGIDNMRTKSPHFNRWIELLEAI